MGFQLISRKYDNDLTNEATSAVLQLLRVNGIINECYIYWIFLYSLKQGRGLYRYTWVAYTYSSSLDEALSFDKSLANYFLLVSERKAESSHGASV